MAFVAKTSIPKVDKETERAITSQFREIQATLDRIDTPADVVTDVKEGNYSARVGELVRCTPPSAGILILLPPGTDANDSGRVRIALENVTSGGVVTVSVVGHQSINNTQTLTLSSVGLTEFVSLGPSGWSALGAGTVAPIIVPTGTGFRHVTAGVEDAAAKLVDTADINANQVTFAKFQQGAANTIVANATAGLADFTAFAVAANSVVGRVAGNLVSSPIVAAQITNNTITAAQITNNTITATQIANNTITDAQVGVNALTAAAQAQMTSNTLKGNPTAGVANEANISVGANTVVGRVAGNIVAAQLVAAQVTANTLTDGLMATNTLTAASQAQMAANTIKSNPSGAAANEADTAIAVDSILARFGGNLGVQTAGANSVLMKGAGNLSFLAAASSDQVFGRLGAAALAFFTLPRILAVSLVTTSQTPFVLATGTQFVLVELWGGGGAGGGSVATALNFGSCGAGGNAGGKVIFFAPQTANFNIVIGAAATGASGTTGNSGIPTTATVNAVALSASGGLGGSTLGTLSSSGQAQPSAAVSGTGAGAQLISGGRGGPARRIQTATAANAFIYVMGGKGGDSELGPGGPEQSAFAAAGVAAGVAGTGFASGGSGACSASTAAAAQTGGSGTVGAARIWQFG